jgi:hypothetical protein
MPTTWNGVATLAGAGSLAGFNASRKIIVGELHLWTASGHLAALAVKRPNQIAVHFSGHGNISIVTRAPRLVASIRFIGDGSFVMRESTSAVLSHASTTRMSFPTFPHPGDPFQRRPSKSYNNYAISVHFAGAGRITAMAS